MKRDSRGGLLADGPRRIAAAERERIEAEAQARFADALARAGLVRRWLVRARMRLTVQWELSRTLRRAAPADGLY